MRKNFTFILNRMPMKMLIFLLFLFSCQKLPQTSEASQKKFFREYKVGTEKEALDLMAVKLTYLSHLYKQNFDSLFKYQKWDPACLEANEIRREAPFSNGFLSVSIIYMSPDFSPGFCPGDRGARKGNFVLLYCRKEKKVIQIRCWEDDCKEMRWEDFC